MLQCTAKHRILVTSPSEEGAPPSARWPHPARALQAARTLKVPREKGVPLAIHTLMSSGLQIGPFTEIVPDCSGLDQPCGDQDISHLPLPPGRRIGDELRAGTTSRSHLACFAAQLGVLEGRLPEALEEGVEILAGWQSLYCEDEVWTPSSPSDLLSKESLGFMGLLEQ
ncbi:hypothetical protein P7K49_002822 [Saguinus oedipus]|uniref:Uncharacterized protein n=1 Tax=Saguinus oedipus TaxID=9490 RepID=A0ABQ9WIE7_SAGOE|nr:hypothetical protein P7K49_002822 [Saguinus oedipus]